MVIYRFGGGVKWEKKKREDLLFVSNPFSFLISSTTGVYVGRGKDKELCIEKEENSDLLSCVYLLSACVPFL